MAEKPKTQPAQEVSETPAPAAAAAPMFTMEQVLTLLLRTIEDNKQSNEKLAEAILESRKPWVDPKVLEAKKQQLIERQREIKLELLRRRETKRQCHHHRVDDQDNPQPKWNIKWHRHSNGIILGVCGRCMSQFDATNNPEDAALLRQDPTALNQMARARS